MSEKIKANSIGNCIRNLFNSEITDWFESLSPDFFKYDDKLNDLRDQVLSNWTNTSLLQLQILDLMSASHNFALERNAKFHFDLLWIGLDPGKKLNSLWPDKFIKESGSQTIEDMLLQVLRCEEFKQIHFHYTPPHSVQDLYKNLKKASSSGKYSAGFSFTGLQSLTESTNGPKNLNTVSDQIIDIIFIFDDPAYPGLARRIQQEIERTSPAIPCVMVSPYHEYTIIMNAYEQGSEFYLPENQLLSMFQIYFDHLEKNGAIIQKIGNFNFQKHVMDTINYWTKRKDYLWFGDKCYHMINHRFQHIQGDWTLLNQVMKVMNRLNGTVRNELDENDIYHLTMGCWLHDIGHRGNRRYGEAYQIRDVHGLLSAEFILQNPALLDLKEPKSFSKAPEKYRDIYDTYYVDMIFPLNPGERHLPEIMRSRQKSNLSSLEKIALLSMYHSSRSPLNQYEAIQLQTKSAVIPSEFYPGGNNTEWYVITAEDIILSRASENPTGNEEKEKLLKLISLLRMVDGLDIRKQRVGDVTEGALKKKVISQDLSNLLQMLEREVNLMIFSQEHEGSPSENALFLWKQLYDIPRKSIQSGGFHIDREFQSILEKEYGPQPNYWKLLNYAAFVSVQDGHFELHSAVDNVNIGIDSGNDNEIQRLHITYELNKNLEVLINNSVQEMHVSSMNLWEKIFGNERKGIDGYAVREIRKVSDYLGDWLNLSRGVRLTVVVPFLESDQQYKKQIVEDNKLSPEDVFENTGLLEVSFSKVVYFDIEEQVR